MNGTSFWQQLFFAIPAIIGALLCLVILFVLIKKPGRLLFFFLCFYLISVLHLAGVFITSLIAKSPGAFGIRQFWEISLMVSRLRYVFLIFLVHSVYRFRITLFMTVVMAIVIGAGAISPFFIYSIIPNLVEIAVILYAFCYWLLVYLMRNRLAISSRRQELLHAVLICSGFFLTGVILDLLEDIPQVSVYVSIFLIDFYPLYLVSIGIVMANWAVRDLYRPLQPRKPGKKRCIDFSGLPVTKREQEIVNLILKGETNAAIAEQLFISESTVKKHINNLFRKLEIGSRWELLKLTGEIEPKE